ncbi:universal stress protein [Janibacter alittae]|uniref:Universal stress protein n=1 Tax=Janibacter alittae TaxID=3115209 RepID=A0ABZ2MG39_9MICO
MILLSYIPTEPGRVAAAAAVREAAAHDTDLVVVNARRGGALVDSRTASDEDLDAIVRGAAEAGVTATIHRPESTDVVAAILDAATEHGAQAVVIGIRHRSPVGKLLLGSTAQQILLEAPCPVIAVKSEG